MNIKTTYISIIAAICFLGALGSFGFSNPTQAATIFEDNFEGYNTGSLNNQGGWTSDSGGVSVHESIVKEGSRAIGVFDPFGFGGNARKQGALTQDGQITIYFHPRIGFNFKGIPGIRLLEGGTDVLVVGSYPGGGVYFPAIWGYYNGDINGYSILPYLEDAWNSLQIQWRSQDHKARYRINNNSWSDWHPGLKSWSSGLDGVELGSVNGLTYFDAIQENPATTIFEDNFEGYNTGSLNNQGGWTSDSGVTVEEDIVREGSKGVKMFDFFSNGITAQKQGTLTQDGQMTIYTMIGDAIFQRGSIILKEGDEDRIEIIFQANQWRYFDGDRNDHILMGQPQTLLTWQAIQVQWRSQDHKARYSLDGGTWSDWAKTKSEWQEGLDTVSITNTGNTFRFDAVGENLIGSSVLFLPGVMGSRLYEDGTRRWEPNSESDVEALYLNQNGKSEKENINATEVIDTFDGPLIFNVKIYDSLLKDLSKIKQKGVISDYTAFPYDWRLSIPDIIESGELEQKLRDLASSSKTRKVTIIAHSNGGLVAKALVNQLGDQADDLIDQIILVAVPQIGTPQAIGALLHGYEMGIPLRFSDARARDFAKNSPTAYHLLPQPDYYNNNGSTISTPLIVFNSGEATQPFIDKYGTDIDITQELYQFIKGEEGRPSPEFNNLEHPSIGNGYILNQALEYLEDIDSDWQPPSGIEVHQIAGIGEDTLSSIAYKTVKECVNPLYITTEPIAYICLGYEPRISYTPNEVIDGDGTVVTPSALVMKGSVDGIKRWWVNLLQNNNDNNRFWIFRLDHKNIFEVDELRQFIFDNLISKPLADLPEFISASQPTITQGKRLRFVLHSPLAFSATDKDSNILNETGSEIPNASYRRYGEVQVITVPSEALPTIKLTGIEDGTFTLEVEEYDNETLVSNTTFSGIPSTADTIATMSFSDGTVENAGNLEIDYNRDNVTDSSLTPEIGEEVTLAEPSLSDLLTILKEYINNLSIKDKLKTNLLKRIDNLEKKIEKKKEKNAKILEKLEEQISKKSMKGKIDTADVNELIEIIDLLEAQSDSVSLDQAILNQLKDKIQSLNIEQSIKNNLLKRVEQLESKQKIIKSLTNLVSDIAKKSEKGKINESDAKIILQLLEQVENNI